MDLKNAIELEYGYIFFRVFEWIKTKEQ